MLTKDKPMEFQPGEGWKYDNSGYVFLGAIIEKASGEKYADYLEKHIFAPLDMNDSGYDVTSKILPNRASGYEPSGSDKLQERGLSRHVAAACRGVTLLDRPRSVSLGSRSLYGQSSQQRITREDVHGRVAELRVWLDLSLPCSITNRLATAAASTDSRLRSRASRTTMRW
jgi:CubicO group peptidase (beta-lactamase class C family)